MAYIGECSTWQGWIQQILYLVANGHEYYCLIRIPKRKLDRVGAIDRKIIERYRCELGKDARYRRKRKGLSSYQYLRYKDTGILLKTPGSIGDVSEDDRFRHVKEGPVIIQIDTLKLKLVQSNQGWTWCLDRDTYRAIKDDFRRLVLQGRRDETIRAYSRLQGIPAWRGVIEQRHRLQEYILKAARLSRIELSRADLRNWTRRKMYPVYRRVPSTHEHLPARGKRPVEAHPA